MNRGSVGLQECPDRHKSKRKETLPPKERRVRKVNPDFRACRELERKANPESPGPGENLGKTVKKEKRGA